MKKIFLCVLVFSFVQSVSQKIHSDTVIFEFNDRLDNVHYRVHHNKKEIAGFNILIGKKKIYFNAGIYNNFKLKNKFSKALKNRIELKKIIQNDNTDRLFIYIILYKKESKYYYVDHIVRKMICE